MDNEISNQELERQEKPLNELLTSSMVNIYVGSENTHWYIHERLLCHYSTFFADIFYADDKNKDAKARKDKAYGLQDEDDLAFEMFVGWLYSRSIKVPTEEKDLGPLLDLYLLSQRLKAEKLSRELVEAVSLFYYQQHTYPSLRRVQHIYANTDDDNEMREMMVGSIAKLLTTSDKIPAHWASALQRNGQLAVDIIRSIQQWKIEEKTIPDARDRSSSRGRSANNGFSAISREGTESMDTNGAASNLGVESLNSDNGDSDQTMQDSQMLRSDTENNVRRPKDNPVPAKATLMPSPSFTSTPSLTTSSSTFSTPRKRPPDSPVTPPSALHSPGRMPRRRLSVSFAEQISYTYTFFPSPVNSAPNTPGEKELAFHDPVQQPQKQAGEQDEEGEPQQQRQQKDGRQENKSQEQTQHKDGSDDGNQRTIKQAENPTTQTDTKQVQPSPTRAKHGLGLTLPARPIRSESDDLVVRTATMDNSQVATTTPTRAQLTAWKLSSQKPETIMLGFLWMLYLSWMATTGTVL